MSNILNQQQLDLAEQLKELVKVGVGGKLKTPQITLQKFKKN